MIKVVVFDFDGVFVLDSDGVFKVDAWKEAMAAYAGRYEAFHAEASGMYGFGKKGGRREIMEYVLTKLGEPADKIPDLLAAGLEQFDAYVQRKILEAGLVPGAMELLESLHSKGISLYLNSGTANDALERSAENLQIAKYLKKSLGSSKNKVDNLNDVMAWEHVSPDEVLMVGDSDSDYRAAQAVGCHFVGVANRWNGWADATKDFPVVKELTAILAHVA